nr:hypothetical protein GCM10020092_019620 [Actinoplanes digitatis]
MPSHDVGLAILTPLRELDQVAYLRFASVYKSFDSLDEFEREITELREAATAGEAAERHLVAARSGNRPPKAGAQEKLDAGSNRGGAPNGR